MAAVKLRLEFRGRILREYRLDPGETTVGRDPDCRICIDSLAVAPRHAVIDVSESGAILRPLDASFRTLVNQRKIEEHSLQDGDRIEIGKHTLSFRDTSADVPVGEPEAGTLPIPDEPVPPEARSPVTKQGYLQVMSGADIGRMLGFDGGLLRLGKEGEEQALISRRKDSYVLTHLEGEATPQVGGKSIDSSGHTLSDGDILQVGPARYQFFTE